MQFSFKPKICSDFLAQVHESTSNSKDFETKDDRHSYFVSEIRDCEKLG